MSIYIETWKLVIVYADVEINEIHPNKYKQRLFIHNLLQGSQPCTLLFGNTQRHSGDWERFIAEEKAGHHWLWSSSDWRSLA